MQIDGEYREAFIDKEHPELKYGTAPAPVVDDQPGLYGSGYVTGNLLGIPKQAKHKDAAWLLMKYLALDDHAEAKLSNGLRNVPTTTTALNSSEIKNDPKFKVFLDVFANPKSSTSPDHEGGKRRTRSSSSPGSGSGRPARSPTCSPGSPSLDKQIDAQLANATGTQVP